MHIYIYMHIHVHIHVQLLVAVQPDTLLLQHLSRSAARAIVCSVCVCVCVQWTPQVDKQLFYFPPCLCALFALFCCLFLLLFLLLLLLQASFSPPLLPLLRLYVHRACACVCALVYEHFLFLLSRIFMQSAALHFLTLQSVAFRVPLCTVLSVCALCLCVCFVCVCNASLRCVVQLH